MKVTRRPGAKHTGSRSVAFSHQAPLVAQLSLNANLFFLNLGIGGAQLSMFLVRPQGHGRLLSRWMASMYPPVPEVITAACGSPSVREIGWKPTSSMAPSKTSFWHTSTSTLSQSSSASLGMWRTSWSANMCDITQRAAE
jgi:hypothetical protein